jgi:hypothetical protein
MCVQRFDDSLSSAIHTTFRALLRSSSMREPRDPLLKVLTFSSSDKKRHCWSIKGGADRRRSTSRVPQWFEGKKIKDDRSVMIPPQVHLRRPCYDFYFL